MGASLRILAFNHHFEQDLDAVRGALRSDDLIVSVPYHFLLKRSRRLVPSRFFEELEMPLAADRGYAKYCKWVRRWIDFVVLVYRPNLLLLPSDTFFYVREAIFEFQRRGIAVCVLQKETTITDAVHETLAPSIGRSLPFISDLMLVCSDRQRDFWIAANTRSDQIQIVGQPRFDVYVKSQGRPDVAQVSKGRPKLLFLSFDCKAYIDSDSGNTSGETWSALKEDLLGTIDRASKKFDVTVKQHPQERDDGALFPRSCEVASRDADTRRLLLDADLVVGFQTTALFEAIAAGKPVLYPAWGPVWERHFRSLIPFHEMSPEIAWVKSRSDLDRVLDGFKVDNGASTASVRFAEEHLGVLDGGASTRAVNAMRLLVEKGGRYGLPAEGAHPVQGNSVFLKGLRRRATCAVCELASYALSVAERLGLGGSGVSARRRFFVELSNALAVQTARPPRRSDVT